MAAVPGIPKTNRRSIRGGLVAEFVESALGRICGAREEMLVRHPEIARADLYAALVLGDSGRVERVLAESENFAATERRSARLGAAALRLFLTFRQRPVAPGRRAYLRPRECSRAMAPIPNAYSVRTRGGRTIRSPAFTQRRG